MSLPARFRHVHYYRIAGKYIFAGDLFITRGALYFFPEIDLDEQREKARRHVPHVAHELALVVTAIIYLTQKTGGSYFSRIDFWEEGISDEQFQGKAKAYIDRLKWERTMASFSQTLPVPTRVSTNEISNMKLSGTGKLSFSAQSDTHDFNIGLLSKNRLRNALWEAGLGRV